MKILSTLIIVCSTLISIAQEADRYTFKNVQIHGGGFISGIVFHPTTEDLAYARTDVGGAYKWQEINKQWIALNDHLTRNQSDFTGVLSLALDPSDDQLIYMLCGLYTQSWAGNGALLVSTDQGQTWDVRALPFKVGGNEDGRSAGERLMVDPNNSDRLLLGTNNDGLWESLDKGQQWTKVNSFPASSVTFVHFDNREQVSGSSQHVLVGTTSTSGAVYRTSNGGQSWTAIANQPQGLLSRRMAQSGDEVFVAYADNLGPNGVTAGAVYRINLDNEQASDISPTLTQGGFGGISISKQDPNQILVSSMNQWWPKNELFLSQDGGDSWTTIMMEPNWPFDDKAVLDHSKTPYTSTHIPHWMGDVQIDPMNNQRAMFTTGYGIYECENLLSATTTWTFQSQGIEETVPLELISPTEGAHLISCLGDIDGFKHDDLDQTPDHRLNPELGTNISMAFAYNNAAVMARTHNVGDPGHISISTDGGDQWQTVSNEPSGVSGGGKVAVNADGTVIVWSPDGANPHYSNDGGQSWTAVAGLPQGLKPVADKVNSAKFYAYDGATGNVYYSANSGADFSVVNSSLPTVQSWELGDATLETEPNVEGGLWLTSRYNGLHYSQDGGAQFSQFNDVDQAYKVTFGKARTGQQQATIFIHGAIDNLDGFYRSDDHGQQWLQINDDAHQFGWINDIAGDPRVYGRLYIGTAGRGVIYAERTDCNDDAGGDAVTDACMQCAGGDTGLDPIFDSNQCLTTGIDPDPILNDPVSAPVFNVLGQQKAGPELDFLRIQKRTPTGAVIQFH